MKKQYFKPRSRAFSVGIDSILAGSPNIDGSIVTGGNDDVPINGIETGGDNSNGDGMNARGGGSFDIGW